MEQPIEGTEQLQTQIGVNNIARLEYGNHGCIIKYISDQYYNIGDRVDIEHSLRTTFNFKELVFDVRGAWYVISRANAFYMNKFYYLLIRGSPTLCQYGEGEVMRNDEAADLFDIVDLKMSDQFFYITFTPGVRRYYTLVKALHRVRRYHIPIFYPDGGIRLVNIYHADKAFYDNPLLVEVVNKLKYPGNSKPIFDRQSNYELAASISDEYAVTEFFEEPGTVFMMPKQGENLGVSNVTINKRYILITKCIVTLEQQKHKGTIYFVEYMDKQLFGEYDEYHSRRASGGGEPSAVPI